MKETGENTGALIMDGHNYGSWKVFLDSVTEISTPKLKVIRTHASQDYSFLLLSTYHKQKNNWIQFLIESARQIESDFSTQNMPLHLKSILGLTDQNVLMQEQKM